MLVDTGRGTPGASAPLGATIVDGGVNFSVFSKHATRMELLLFESADARPSQILALDPDRNRTYHYWHAFVPGLQAGQFYAHRNFVTCHDGFTLNDLVSYDVKRNEANGEHNIDGSDDDLSWNCGVEGPTTDPVVVGAVDLPAALVPDGSNRWCRWLDTALLSPDDVCDLAVAPPVAAFTYVVQPRSVAVLVRGLKGIGHA